MKLFDTLIFQRPKPSSNGLPNAAPTRAVPRLALAVFFTSFLLLTPAGCRRGPAVAEGHRQTVKAVRVSSQELPNEVEAAGAIESVDTAEVAFLVTGRVLTVNVQDGASVEKGQVLAQLDPTDFQQGVAIADAKLREIRARHERLTRLRDLGSLTASDYDKIESALHEAESTDELAQRQLAYTELRAPFSGQVVRRGIAVGQVVVPAVPVFTVLAPAPVWANVGVAEADAHSVRPGQPARVCLPAENSRLFPGTVDAILPQADPLSRSFTVKIRIANADHTLHPGNVVTARISIGSTHMAVTLPPQAVQKYPDGAVFVWTIDPLRHTAVRQIVEAGALEGTVVEIRSGLKPGELVVTSVPTTLFEGMPLNADTDP